MHVCMPDSPTDCMNRLSFSKIREIFTATYFNITFVGHIRRMMLMDYDVKDLYFDHVQQKIVQLKLKYRYVVNGGALDQPRDGDLCAN